MSKKFLLFSDKNIYFNPYIFVGKTNVDQCIVVIYQKTLSCSCNILVHFVVTVIFNGKNYLIIEHFDTPKNIVSLWKCIFFPHYKSFICQFI